MIVEREIPTCQGFSHNSICLHRGYRLRLMRRTGEVSGIRHIHRYGEHNIRPSSSVLEGIHRMPLRLLHKDVEVRIYLGGVSAFCRYLDLSMPPDTSIILGASQRPPTATTQGHASVWPLRPFAGRGKCLRKYFRKRSEEERYQCDSANFQKHVWLSEIEVKNGEQEGIRTPGLQLRRLLPYPD